MITSATLGLAKLVVLYYRWSSFIWYKEEDFPSNVGLFKPKMTTSATLGLGKNCPHNYLLTFNCIIDILKISPLDYMFFMSLTCKCYFILDLLTCKCYFNIKFEI